MKRLPIPFLCAVTAFILAGCGGDSDRTDESRPGVQQPSGEVREVVIEGNDRMEFDVETFEVEAGERIRLILKNVGTMPKVSMGHNVVILEKAVDPAAFAEKAMNAAANDYIPEDSDQQIVAQTELLGGGEEDSIIFTVPLAPGEYPYICSFPGHFEIGMRGTMVVQ